MAGLAGFALLLAAFYGAENLHLNDGMRIVCIVVGALLIAVEAVTDMLESRAKKQAEAEAKEVLK